MYQNIFNQRILTYFTKAMFHRLPRFIRQSVGTDIDFVKYKVLSDFSWAFVDYSFNPGIALDTFERNYSEKMVIPMTTITAERMLSILPSFLWQQKKDPVDFLLSIYQTSFVLFRTKDTDKKYERFMLLNVFINRLSNELLMENDMSRLFLFEYIRHIDEYIQGYNEFSLDHVNSNETKRVILYYSWNHILRNAKNYDFNTPNFNKYLKIIDIIEEKFKDVSKQQFYELWKQSSVDEYNNNLRMLILLMALSKWKIISSKEIDSIKTEILRLYEQKTSFLMESEFGLYNFFKISTFDSKSSKEYDKILFLQVKNKPSIVNGKTKLLIYNLPSKRRLSLNKNLQQYLEQEPMTYEKSILKEDIKRLVE